MKNLKIKHKISVEFSAETEDFQHVWLTTSLDYQNDEVEGMREWTSLNWQNDLKQAMSSLMKPHYRQIRASGHIQTVEHQIADNSFSVFATLSPDGTFNY